MEQKNDNVQKLKDAGLFPKGVRVNASHRKAIEALTDSDVKALVRSSKKVRNADGKRPVALGIFSQ